MAGRAATARLEPSVTVVLGKCEQEEQEEKQGRGHRPAGSCLITSGHMRGTRAHCDRSVPLGGLCTLWLALGTHGPFYPPKKPTRISKHCSRQLTCRHVLCTPARSCAMPPPPGRNGEGHVRDSSLQGCVWHGLSRAPALPHGMGCVLLLL